MSVELPAFCAEAPDIWFLQAEAKFAISGITSKVMQFFYVIAALEKNSEHVLDIIKNLPPQGKYSAIKERLISHSSLNDYQRAAQLLHMRGLGDDKPSTLMNNMLALHGSNKPCYLFRQLFLEHMPDDIRAHLIQLNLTDPRLMAQKADIMWTMQRSSTNADSSKGELKNSTQRKNTTASPNSYCFYHKQYGAKARKCQEPCSY